MGNFWTQAMERAYVPDYFGFDDQNAWMTIKWAVLVLAIVGVSLLSQTGQTNLASLIMGSAALTLAIPLVRKIAWNYESKEEVATEFIKNYWNTRAYRRYLETVEV